MEENIREAKKCLNALGSAYRNDWSNCDGRAIRDELDGIHSVLDGKINYEEYCKREQIDPISQSWI
jgi:hypothetical protein